MKLSIIIVNYNTYKLTKQTIEAVLSEKTNFEYEILLVDNASTDGSIQDLQEDFKDIIEEKKLRVFRNGSNLGFAKANNRGIKEALGEYILLLNSDTVVKEGCLASCMKRIEEDEHIGALGCKVVLADGTLDHACKRGFPTPKASLYYLLKLDKVNPIKYGVYDALALDEDEEGEVDCLTGAFMLMPKAILDKVGILDEVFFMYGEDIDLCYRIKEAGYKILYYPKAEMIHFKGGSSKKKRKKVIYDFHHAMWIFYKKHYYKTYNMWINGLVYIGIWTKYILAIIANLFKIKG